MAERGRSAGGVVGRRSLRRRLPVLVFALLCGIAGCGVNRQTPSAPPAVDATLAGFESFSGVHLPATADRIELSTHVDDVGRPVYLVGFDLPTDDVDRMCRDGALYRPLHIITVHDSIRERFGYRGDATTGIRWGAGSLLGDVGVQRELLAVGTFTDTAHVQIHAYRMGR